MTAPNPRLAAEIAATGIPLTADLAPTLRDRMTALVASQKQHAAVERLRLLLAERPHQAATPGEAAEQRHLLHDADPDSTFHTFPDLTKGKPWRAK